MPYVSPKRAAASEFVNAGMRSVTCDVPNGSAPSTCALRETFSGEVDEVEEGATPAITAWGNVPTFWVMSATRVRKPVAKTAIPPRPLTLTVMTGAPLMRARVHRRSSQVWLPPLPFRRHYIGKKENCQVNGPESFGSTFNSRNVGPALCALLGEKYLFFHQVRLLLTSANRSPGRRSRPARGHQQRLEARFAGCTTSRSRS